MVGDPHRLLFRSVQHNDITSSGIGRKETNVARYEHGDFVKVEFLDEPAGIGEWMWIRVNRCDGEKNLVFGILDNEPLNDYEGKVGLGSELVISYSQIREHRKPAEFTRQ